MEVGDSGVEFRVQGCGVQGLDVGLWGFCRKRVSIKKLSGNEVDHTA